MDAVANAPAPLKAALCVSWSLLMNKTWFFTTLKFVPIFALVAIPATIVYGFISPWGVSKEALSKYENNLVLLVGFKNKSGSVGGKSFDRKSKTYIIVDDNLQSRTITIFAEFDKFHKVEEEEGGLLMLVVWYLVFIIISWYFWLMPHNKQRNADSGANAPPPVR